MKCLQLPTHISEKIVMSFLFIFVSGDYIRAETTTMTVNDSVYVCKEHFDDTRTYFTNRKIGKATDTLPTIYFVTPTYPRREQIAELTRLGQTLMHIPNLHWIVADDVDTCNTYLDVLLKRFGKGIYR